MTAVPWGLLGIFWLWKDDSVDLTWTDWSVLKAWMLLIITWSAAFFLYHLLLDSILKITANTNTFGKKMLCLYVKLWNGLLFALTPISMIDLIKKSTIVSKQYGQIKENVHVVFNTCAGDFPCSLCLNLEHTVPWNHPRWSTHVGGCGSWDAEEAVKDTNIKDHFDPAR